MSSQKRTYELRARADRQAETRRKIVEATVALHSEVGPARTTVAEIARRAGVSRLTVYNHFPDDRELFTACSASFLAANPRPDLQAAMALGDPVERVRAILAESYRWYRQTESMSENVQRDRGGVDAIDAILRETVDAPLDQLAAALADGFDPGAEGDPQVRPLIRLALDFFAWQRLRRQGLADTEAADLMARAISCLAAY